MQFKEVQLLVEKSVKELSYPKKPINLYDPIDYIMSLGGKRMRPCLAIMGSNMFNGNLNTAVSNALAVEVFHNFTLLHDDIMDNAPLRRGNETVHEKWDSNIAILSGDAMMVQAYQHLANGNPNRLKQSLDVFSKTAIEVCEGQQYDMDFETQDNVQIEDYLEMIRLKTAVLLGASLKLGAVNAEASDKDAELIYNFGEKVGIAFQLKDDILDAYGNPETFGKKVGGDIVENKKTYLLLKAFDLANETQKTDLNKALEIQNEQEKIETVLSIYNELNIRELAEKKAQAYFEDAFKVLEEISVSNESKRPLLELVQFLISRLS